MSNQLDNGFEGSQPFITDKEFQNLSLDEIRNIIEQEKKALKKDYNELKSRRRLIRQYKKIQEARNQVKKRGRYKKEIQKESQSKKGKKI